MNVPVGPLRLKSASQRSDNDPPAQASANAKLDALFRMPVRAGLAGRSKVPEEIAETPDIETRELARASIGRVSRRS
jgi:hypothetical protein